VNASETDETEMIADLCMLAGADGKRKPLGWSRW
jgi:hypothetical protein